VLAEEKLPTHPDKGGVKAFTATLGNTVRKLVHVADKRGLKVKYLGVGCAGDIDLTQGVIRSSPNLSFLDSYPMRDKLQRFTGARVFVGHDVQAAVYGELVRGVARKARHVIGVWIGTGVGGALVLDRKLFLGVSGRAGDLGNYLLHAVDVSQELPARKSSTMSRAARPLRAMRPHLRQAIALRVCNALLAQKYATWGLMCLQIQFARVTRQSRSCCAAALASSA